MYKNIYKKLQQLSGFHELTREILSNLATVKRTLKNMGSDIDLLKQAVGRMEINEKSRNNNVLFRENSVKVFSQFGEDGIIQYLIKNIHIKNKLFVEFGSQNYTESNTRFLLVNNNWSGLIIDGNEENINYVKSDQIYWKYNLKAVSSFVTAENINQILADNSMSGEIGLLSVDIDGNDYWVWKAIDVVKPALVIVEYNHRFGAEKAVTVPYRADFTRTKAHYSGIYYGASLKALCSLGKTKGYDFVGCNDGGNNAFFVRKDLRPESIPMMTSEEGFVVGQFRETRDEDGNLAFLTIDKEHQLLASLPLEEVDCDHG